jgi:hypothetical protein
MVLIIELRQVRVNNYSLVNKFHSVRKVSIDNYIQVNVSQSIINVRVLFEKAKIFQVIFLEPESFIIFYILTYVR